MLPITHSMHDSFTKDFTMESLSSKDETSSTRDVACSHNFWTSTPDVRWRRVVDGDSFHSERLNTIERVREALYNLPVGDTEKEFDLLSKISGFRNVRQILTSILESSEYLQGLADKSYRHENGFSKLVLTSSKTHSLRLHIYWNDSADNYQENIHNHRWDFSSFILKGTLVQDFFGVIDAEQAIRPSNVELFRHYSYKPLRSPDKVEAVADNKLTAGTPRYQTTYVGNSFVKKKSELTIPKGFGYCLHRTELHRVRYIKNSGIGMTLVLYTAPYNPICDLYSVNEQFGDDSKRQHETKDYTVETFRKDLMLARELISDDH